MQYLTRLTLNLAEQGLFPDVVLRWGIRQLLTQRLQEIRSSDARTAALQETQFIDQMRRAPIAVVPEKANDQHYEVPVEFFRQVLGPHLKYSSAFWPANATTLGQAEAAGLRESCLHAGLVNGQTILELGCGWGSLTLWMAEHYPDSRITAVSNSRSQRAYIEAQARERGLQNQVRVMTCDMNTFEIDPGQFDRVVSVEMFEHMRNWPDLFAARPPMAETRRPVLHARVRASRYFVPLRRPGTHRLDESSVFHGRDDAQRWPPAGLSGPSRLCGPLAVGRHAL